MSVSTHLSTKGIIGLSVCSSFRNLERREMAFFSASTPSSPCFSKNSLLCRCNVSITLVKICGVLSLIVRYAKDPTSWAERNAGDSAIAPAPHATHWRCSGFNGNGYGAQKESVGVFFFFFFKVKMVYSRHIWGSVSCHRRYVQLPGMFISLA